MLDTNRYIELMAPAGNFESLQAAIDNGADSVYFGVEQLNMRAVSSINFVLEDIPEIVARCAPKGIRTYITLNTIVYDHDMNMVKNIVGEAKKHGITAIIAADHAVIAYARSIGMEVHISTQVNVTNVETVKFYALFADTVVLSRELSLNQIKKITDAIEKEQIKGPSGKLVEIEIFGHGALCMAVSGKCYLSLHTHNSSANRGACRQNCRKKYTVTDEDGIQLEIDNEYIMSPQDLCTIDFLDKVLDAGVSVLKIEGRGRAADYVATTIKCYREAIDAYKEDTYSKEKVENWMERLATVYNRGFWSGYYLGQELGEWTKDHPGSHATRKKLFVGTGEHYFTKAGIAQFKLEAFDIKIGDKMLITGPTTGVKEFDIDKLMVNDIFADQAVKGDQVTIPLDFKIRKSDKLYKLVEA
ncbi:U32 family peptidase [Solitalea sp. MAHUQ-68]|uniref:U32 family peptidase n=1 Tax=Solitalea agri TaxID=2953739 RepID=A0A9X2F040_9SPHI|nr:peptidase U32 family protein [Solitalea agri]MCO4291649.1 U32 family peptidase [Solitalea agri]